MALKLRWIMFCLLAVIFNACKDDDPEVPVSDSPYTLDAPGFPTPTIPAENPLTQNGVALGRLLFYEERLSSNNQLACAGCHRQENAFSDPRQYSLGVDGLPGHRQAMAIFNMAWNTNGFFWDGRAASLHQQALMPIQDVLEMKETLPNVVAKLQADSMYPRLFEAAFGTREITTERIGKALEQFMLSIVSNRSKYDRFLKGELTLTAEEERGRFLFETEFNPAFPEASGADCRHCHGGLNLENDRYMNNGLDSDAAMTDMGHQNVSGDPADKARFKVPSLRNIALTAPYMHDGRFSTLEQVVDHYNQVTASSTLDASFAQQMPGGLNLSSSDKAALVAFLHTLTDEALITDTRYSDPAKN